MDDERRTARLCVVVRVRYALWPFQHALVVRVTVVGVPEDTWLMIDGLGKRHELRRFRVGGDDARRNQ